ncbi:MAG: hypothetical protein IJW50_05290 [Clostridia bacterium]|nr:hypothetical protein [Clostridia bacterium]
MKYSKCLLLLYSSCLLKLLWTGVILNFILDPTFTIVTILMSCVMAYNPELLMVCIVVLFIDLLLWLNIIGFGLFGIKFKRARRISVVLITIATAMDLIASLIIYDVVWKIKCTLVSIIFLALCVLCLFKQKKQAAILNS